MLDYLKTAEGAFASILDAGLTLTAKRLTGGVYDPVTGEETTQSTEQTWNLAAVVLPATVARFRGIDNRLTEGLILAQARYLLASALNDSGTVPEPLPEDRILLDGKTWRVIGATPIKPASVAVIYQIGIVLES